METLQKISFYLLFVVITVILYGHLREGNLSPLASIVNLVMFGGMVHFFTATHIKKIVEEA